jgi:hypothetical protein
MSFAEMVLLIDIVGVRIFKLKRPEHLLSQPPKALFSGLSRHLRVTKRF